jgi:hypothetical protein
MAKRKKKPVTLHEDPMRKKIRDSRAAERRHNRYLIAAISVGISGLAVLWFFAARDAADPEYEFTVALQRERTAPIEEVLPATEEAPRGRAVFTLHGKRVEVPIKTDEQAALKEGDRARIFYRQGTETKEIRVETWLPAKEEQAQPDAPARPPEAPLPDGSEAP